MTKEDTDNQSIRDMRVGWVDEGMAAAEAAGHRDALAIIRQMRPLVQAGLNASDAIRSLYPEIFEHEFDG